MLMMMRNKSGKVHPFTSSNSSSSSSPNIIKDSEISVLKLLPSAIFTLISVLSLEERQVLAYMITRSLKSKPTNKQSPIHSHSHGFECDCFHCYTSFWFRWDSSPNRDLIHQAIEAFEDHLITNNRSNNNKLSKRKDKSGRHKVAAAPPPENQQERVIVSSDLSLPENELPAPAPAPSTAVVHNHKGFARKMLPDVMGIFNSRLWSLWSPNV